MECKNTRERLIDAAFAEIHERGYQGAALADILAKAGVHKGSMYHFFANKKELALTALKEKISAYFVFRYGAVATSNAPYLPRFFAVLLDASTRDFSKGCPLANMVQEMSNIDADFDATLKGLYGDLRATIKTILDKAVESGELKEGCDTARLALFVTVVIEGGILSAKASGDAQDFVAPIEELIKHIETYKKDKNETKRA